MTAVFHLILYLDQTLEARTGRVSRISEARGVESRSCWVVAMTSD